MLAGTQTQIAGDTTQHLRRVVCDGGVRCRAGATPVGMEHLWNLEHFSLRKRKSEVPFREHLAMKECAGGGAGI
ncbi:hypothetical protein [Paraburkholderia youngii]|uniref:hypothetical protein n=1 Tax=Paraburkholderia youngii TaxID=2782701 RepID=UPI003D24545D